jgi:hypothetical protein
MFYIYKFLIDRKCVITLLIIALFPSSSNVFAQSAKGIYLTVNDFINNKIEFNTSENKNCKIKLHAFSFNSKIKIVKNGRVFRLNKDSIYGYVDWKGLPIRFYNKKIYTILFASEQIFLYKQIVKPQSKYSEALYTYHFSTDAGSLIFPLTIKNLESSFNYNSEFLKLLEAYFKSEKELIEYDQIHNTYKLIRLLQLSKIE